MNLDSIHPCSLHGWRQEGVEDGPSDVTTTPLLDFSFSSAQSGLMVSGGEQESALLHGAIGTLRTG